MAQGNVSITEGKTEGFCVIAFGEEAGRRLGFREAKASR